MTLDQLRYFITVCQNNSISRAAEMLNISQPSISSAISKLEADFGVMLFSRQHKRLTLTKEGAVLLKYANYLIKDADEINEQMKRLSDNKALNIGVPPMLSSFVLPILYGDFFKKHPDFKINIIEDDRSGLMKMLDDNRINMAFLPHNDTLDDKLNYQLITELDNVCCVSKNHKLAKNSSVSIEDLSNEDLVLFKNSFFQTERIIERFRQSDINPNILLHTAQVSTVQNMVANGVAIGFIFDFLLDSTPDLLGIPLNPPMHTKVSLVWNKSEYLSNNMLRIIRFIKKYSSKKINQVE